MSNQVHYLQGNSNIIIRNTQYVGSCETDFKTRRRNHMHSFKNIKLKNETFLSKEICKLRNDVQSPTMTWNLIKQATSYRSSSSRCNLCLEEKLATLQADQSITLNKRSELISHCRHRNKYKLHNIK